MSDLNVLRKAAEAAIEYRSGLSSGDHRQVAEYEDVLTAFDAPLPEHPVAAEEAIAELVEKASPGLRPITSASFFGWVMGGSHPAGVAADWLTSAWGQNAGNIAAAPAAAAAEHVTAKWLLELLGLPSTASVGFVTGATMANFVALASARGELLRRQGWDADKDGLFGAPPVPVLIGADAHATVFAALRYLGLGSGRVGIIETDDFGRMRAQALERALASTATPALVISQAGQINTGACDPFEQICAIGHERGAWIHVDGAFGLWAQASRRLRHLTKGVNHADSWATDGHKWLQLPYDSGFAIVRDRTAHERSMTIEASYLPRASVHEREPASYVPELSRRARGFPAWSTIRSLGRAGIEEMIERHCDFAKVFAKSLSTHPRIRVVTPVILNQVMLRFGDSDDATLETVREIQRRGRIFVGPALWRGEWIMRISVSNFETQLQDDASVCGEIKAAWEAVQRRSRAVA